MSLSTIEIPRLEIAGDPRTAAAEETIARLALAPYAPPIAGPMEIEIVRVSRRLLPDPWPATETVRRALEAWAPGGPHLYTVTQREGAPCVVVRIHGMPRRRTLHALAGDGPPPRTLGVP